MITNVDHRPITGTALPYITNASPTDNRLRFVAGANVMTSIKGFLERRPGFGAYTADDFSSDQLQRFFCWSKWDGTFYVMACEVEGSASKVYSLEVGTDTTFQALHTDSTSSEPFDFAVANDHVFFCNGTDMMKWDGTNLTNWGITKPSSAVMTGTTAGSLSPTKGYKYVIAWHNSTTGHTSSPSPLMTAFVKPSSQNVTLSGNTTSDSQVSHVKVYRTLDGGSVYFEHPSSPVAYATWTGSGLTDSASDESVALGDIAPLQNQNNPPPPAKGVKWFAGRLWVFYDDKIAYSGWEEIPQVTSDLPEEAFPIDNYYPWGDQVNGLGVAGDPVTGGILTVMCGGGIHRISGDSLDTFTRGTVAKVGRGLRNRAALTEFKKIVVWLDASNTIQMTDGNRIEEISIDIRPDLASINHSTAGLATYSDGVSNWLVLMDGSNKLLIVYDADTEQWMVPWLIDNAGGMAVNLEGIGAGETAPGVWKLFVGSAGRPLAMDKTDYQDIGTSQTATATLGLIPIVPDELPDSIGSIVHVAVERNSVANSTVQLLLDEDPSGATYTTLSDASDPTHRTQGTNLVEKRYQHGSSDSWARRASVRLNWAAANSNFKTYTIDLAHKVVGQ